MRGAIKMYDYFIANNKKLRVESWAKEKVEKDVDLRLSKRKQFEYLFQSNPKIKDSEASKTLEVHRNTIANWRKEIGKNNNIQA
jgi:hypothetical protein